MQMWTFLVIIEKNKQEATKVNTNFQDCHIKSIF